MLIFTYHLYGDAYLSTDDFNNLYWAQRQNGVQTIEHLVNPASSAVRPTGMAFYWVLFNIFHVNAAPYHWTAWLLHAINTWLVYLVLKRITGSQAGGVIGAMLFASQAAFADIYWNFGSIFELLSAMGFFVGILWWLKQPRSWTIVLACTVLFLFSLKAKEMAITLPAIWLLCDLVLQKKPFIKTAGFLLPPAALGIWFGLRKLGELGSSDPTGLHYMDLQWITLGRGLGVFFNELFNATLRWQFWSIGFAGVLLFLVLRKSRGGLFFQTYFLITFLPVIFMINHRELYLSYIPFLGLCGLACLLVQALTKFIEPKLGARSALVGYAVLPALCWGTYVVQRRDSEERRMWQKPMAIDYRAFVSELAALPAPKPNEIIYFDSHPIHFTGELLRNATEVALRRTDIQVQLVSTFPAEARYKLHYEKQRLTQVP
ncbi:MAG TPA: hypothetical protein VFR18_01575 [Terriglobia bacterium]|nr:hypothetical protein [Terriglobia bacterium]